MCRTHSGYPKKRASEQQEEEGGEEGGEGGGEEGGFSASSLTLSSPSSSVGGMGGENINPAKKRMIALGTEGGRGGGRGGGYGVPQNAMATYAAAFNSNPPPL